MKDIDMAGRKDQRNHESLPDHDDDDTEMDDEQLQELYAWVDKIPFSRSKKNITRDFSDGGNLLLCFDNTEIVNFLNKCKGGRQLVNVIKSKANPP